MSETVISIENVSKSYQLGVIGTGTFYGDLKRWWAKQRGNPDPYQKIGEVDHGNRQGEALWALKDINFQVQQGEVLGIIGRNGAGKSTLLKILSRVTAPTSGEVKVKGRIASLLEVGTGFHPELTGRENIYLNGAIMGMDKAEISRKFDEIVDFSGVEKFIDTPVKRYSSGMYVRLAFAVAAHLEPEILIVDEVLAVGDAEFQKKCLGKMGNVAREGRTVLFVSHNMGAIRVLCESAILLSNGRSRPKQTVENTIVEYSSSKEDNIQRLPFSKDEIVIHAFDVTQDGYNVTELDGDKPIAVTINFELLQDLTLFRIGFFLNNTTGDLILRSLMADWNPAFEKMQQGRYEVSCQIPPRFVTSDNYVLALHCSRYGIKDYALNEVIRRQVTIHPSSNFNLGHIGERTFGSLLLDSKWSVRKVE